MKKGLFVALSFSWSYLAVAEGANDVVLSPPSCEVILQKGERLSTANVVDQQFMTELLIQPKNYREPIVALVGNGQTGKTAFLFELMTRLHTNTATQPYFSAYSEWLTTSGEFMRTNIDLPDSVLNRIGELKTRLLQELQIKESLEDQDRTNLFLSLITKGINLLRPMSTFPDGCLILIDTSPADGVVANEKIFLRFLAMLHRVVTGIREDDRNPWLRVVVALSEAQGRALEALKRSDLKYLADNLRVVHLQRVPLQKPTASLKQ